MKKFRKRPETIEAVQWTGDNIREVKEFVFCSKTEKTGDQLEIRMTRVEGGGVGISYLILKLNHWLAKADGSYGILSPDEMKKKYEEIE